MKLMNKSLNLIRSFSFNFGLSVVVIFMVAISVFNIDNRIYLDVLTDEQFFSIENVLTDEQFFSIERCPLDISPTPPPAIWGPGIRPDFYGHGPYYKQI